jgi:class 3 adenylate cyclase
MDFRILGPLEAHREGRPLPLGGLRQGALLAVLLLHANEVVSTDRLLEELWEEPPASGTKALQVSVSRLRRSLGDGLLRTRPPGYVLEVRPDDVDLQRFERLVRRGKEALVHDPAGAANLLREALALWRGPALAEFASEPFARIESLRLEALRIDALEDRIEADLALGRHAQLVGELEALVAVHPLRERLRGQLMLALYRGGRHPEALEVYKEGRNRLVDELGLDPSPALRHLESAMLRQDAGLELATPAKPEERPPAVELAEVAAERKLVTVLFADLVESTTLAERLDPERLRALLAEYFRPMASTVERWGGTVEKFIGDAVMAVFGIPSAHENDAERALRAAAEMQVRLGELNPDLAARHGVELAIRIGVNTGEAIVGGGGDQLLVTGDVVNTAARLQQRAEPGEIVAGDRTALAARRAFVFTPLEYTSLRGKSLPVRAWLLVEAAQPARRHHVPGSSARYVGRVREFSLLETLYQASIEAGQPHLVTIVGEAGIGKTRLTEEFLARAERQDPRPASCRGRCLPYGDGIAYWALHEILWDAAGILLGDTGPVAAAKLQRLVQRFAAPEAERMAFALAISAGISLADNPLERASPESIGEELSLAWPWLLSALASEGPLIILVEDLHWAEPSLLNMVEHLVARATGPVLLLATARPALAEMRPRWSSRPEMSQIGLEPLSEADAGVLLSQLLPAVGASLRDEIVAAAEGNPFFIEEIVRHLLDERVLAPDGDRVVESRPGASVVIPDTIRSLLAARVDALTSDEKQALQDAAVVGRTFWASAVESMRPGHPIRDALFSLEDKGLVVVRHTSSLAGESEFGFRHGLIREVAYQSLPKARRPPAHAAIAAWIEQLAGDRREEFVDLIAHHCEAAARPDDAELAWPSELEVREELRAKAVGALLEAGEAARKRFAIDQAIGFGDRVLSLASADNERLAALELKAQSAHAAVRAEEAWRLYREALDLARRASDRESAARVTAHATLLWSRYGGAFGSSEWLPVAEEMLAEAFEQIGDEEMSFAAGALLVGRSSLPFWRGRTREQLDLRDAERAVEIAEAIGSAYLLSYAVDNLAMLAGTAGFCRSGDLAEKTLRVGREMAGRVESHETLVSAAILFAQAYRFTEAREAADEALRQAASLGTHHRIHAGSAAAQSLVPQGELARLREATAKVPALVLEEGGHTCLHGIFALGGRALALFEAGDDAEALRTLQLLDAAGSLEDRTLNAAFCFAAEVLRPFLGIDAARDRLASIPAAPDLTARVYRLRAELRLTAVEDAAHLAQLSEQSRALAGEACAPALVELAEFAEAAQLAATGRSTEAIARARTAADSLDQLGERYTAARMLVDLLPMLAPDARRQFAAEAVARLTAMGALRSAAEASGQAAG